MTLIVYLCDIYLPSRLQISAGTIEQMEIAVRQVRKQVARDVLVRELSEDLVLSHLHWLIHRDKPASIATVNNRRGYLLTIWRHAYRKKHCDNDPNQADIPVIPELECSPQAWPLSDLARMLDQAKKTPVRMGFGPKHWIALITLLYYTGLRIKATLLLKRSCLHGHILIVPAQHQKNRKELVVKLPNSLVNQLLALPRPRIVRHGRSLGEMLIPWPWSFDHIQDKLRDYILLPAGLPNDPKLKFHAIRRTVATVLAAKEGDEAAMKALGHSSIAMTRRYIGDILLVAPELDKRLHPMDSLPRLGDIA